MSEVQAAAAVQTATATHGVKPRPRVVGAQRTATHPTEFRAALKRAHRTITGKEATPELLDVLTAHVSHETASGDKMYNYNFGGIKGRSPEGLTARYKTTEFYSGRKTKIVDGFRAYRTLDDGAQDYLLFLQGRYHKAFARAEQGDVDGFSHALKSKGYYTAPASTYARAMRHHMDNPGAYAGTSVAARAGSGARYLYGAELAAEGMESNATDNALPTSVQVARVMDAMSALAARIGSPAEEADEDMGS